MVAQRVDPSTLALADTLPPNLTVMTAQAGSSQKASRGDHTHPVRVQRARVLSDSNGSATWIFATPFLLTPVISCMIENTQNQPMIANILELDVNHVKVQLFQSQKLPATLTLLSALVSFNIFGVSNTLLANVGVNLFAAEPTT